MSDDDVPAGPDAVLATPAERAGGLGARLDELLAVGDDGCACALVATSFAERSDAGDLAEVAALISALPDTVLAQHPGALLELARACEAEGRVRLRSRLLERVERLPVPAGSAVGVALAVEAERICDAARDGRADEVEKATADLLGRLDDARDEAGSAFVREARARSQHALGWVLAWRGDPMSIQSAEDALQAAAGAARELGRHEWRAAALQVLGYNISFYRGEELRATSRLQEAIDLLPVGHPRRCGMSTYLADVFVRSHVGEPALAVLEQTRREASESGDQRSLGYAAWVLAVLYAERGDGGATLEWLAEAERHPGDWFAHPTGLEFLAEAAVSAERAGELAAADRYLKRAEQRADEDGYPETAWFAIGMINARRGDPARAIVVLAKLLDEDWLPTRDAWSVWLHLALARLRAGDEQGAAQDAARGFEAASSLVGPGRAAATRDGLPDVLTRLEADLVRRLAPVAASTGSALAAALHPVLPRIRLFGGLSVQIGATTAAVPPGRPALLLMLVALARRPVPIDVAIEQLWPGVSGDVGRRRLRNVQARIKASCGELIVRRHESLALDPDIVVDVAEFEVACARVDRALPRDKPALARAALGLARAELLPEAAYAPRIARVRDELDRRTVQLLEIVASDAERGGRTDETIAALARIADIDPYDVEVPDRVARLLSAAGRPEQAQAWRERVLDLDD